MATRLLTWIAALIVSGLAMVFLLAGAARAQEATGDWNGAIHLPIGDHRLAVRITGKPGSLAGTVASPEVSDRTAPLDDIRVEEGRLAFAIPSLHATFQGRWDPAGLAWVGLWTQGIAYPVTLARGLLASRPVVAGLDGTWAGVVATPSGAKLRLVLHIRTNAGGTIVLMDSPDQLAYAIPIIGLTRAGQRVAFQLPVAHASYDGVLSADGRILTGIWTQGASTPLTLTWTGETAAVARRPQTPKPPYPYREEEVMIDSAAGVKLAGTLSLPNGKGPFPAAVLITGSGAQDRDETILGHKPFAVIADRLTRDGIAVLRVDDRGFGKSTGDFAKATTRDFADDAAANVAFLRGRADIDSKRIGLIGHSEGGLIAPIVAAKDPTIGFVVLLAGPGVPLADVLKLQRAELAPAMGLSPKAAKLSQAMTDAAFAAMHGAKDDADAEARAIAAMTPYAKQTGATPAQISGAARQLSSGWMRQLIDYDPRPTLAKVTCPILAVNGSKDLQVPARQNLPAIRLALRGNRDATVTELPGLNHLLQTAKTGAAGEYADIEETVAPIALDTVSAWIVKHTR